MGKQQEKEQQDKAWQGKKGKDSQMLIESPVKSSEILGIWQSQAKHPCRPWSSKRAVHGALPAPACPGDRNCGSVPPEPPRVTGQPGTVAGTEGRRG